MRINRWVCIVGLCGALALSMAPAGRSAVLLYHEALLEDDTHEDQLYSEATKAIDEGRWSDAEPLLEQVLGLHGHRSDAAVYWKAYVKNKEGRPSDALETCASLRQNYPQSNWLNDCSALEIEIKGKSGSPVQPQAEQDEDLKLLALSSIAEGDNSNSLPILEQVLQGQHSERLKERALFVLAQNQSKQGQELLGQIVRGEKDPNLQIKAIRLLAAAQGSSSAPTLESIYGKSNDPSVKKAVLDAYLVMNDPEKLVQAAQHESDPQLAHHAVSELGAMGAVSRLSEIYRATSSKELKSAILNAYVAAGSKERMLWAPLLPASRIRSSDAERSATWVPVGDPRRYRRFLPFTPRAATRNQRGPRPMHCLLLATHTILWPWPAAKRTPRRKRTS